MPGVPLPERLSRKRNKAAARVLLAGFETHKGWDAGVSKVESCSLGEYDGGRGLKTIFEPRENEPRRRCNLICTGDTNKLTILLEVTVKPQDPSPRILHRFELPSDDDRIGIRMYDVDVSIEFREHPRNPKQRKSTRRAEEASGECWVVHLETSMKEQVMAQAKRMLRRLGSVTNAMPDDWFSYRNYVGKQVLGEPLNKGSMTFRDGVFSHGFAGGYTWRFTGNLASDEFQAALMGKLPNEAQEEVPKRVQPFRTSKGKKSAKKIPGKERRFRRVQQRSMVPHGSSQETPESMGQEQQPERSSPAALPSVSELPERSSPLAFSSESEPEPEGRESEESDELYPIEGLLGKEIRDGEIFYLVHWSGPYKEATSWQREANVSAESIAEFEKNNADKAKGKDKA